MKMSCLFHSSILMLVKGGERLDGENNYLILTSYMHNDHRLLRMEEVICKLNFIYFDPTF